MHPCHTRHDNHINLYVAQDSADGSNQEPPGSTASGGEINASLEPDCDCDIASCSSGKRPDFLFPSEAAYKDPTFAAAHLRLLAVKTTCKDRWRQVINEADRIPVKHLLTLQEGVSETQFAEMKAAGVRLVIPAPLAQKFPESVQPELTTLEDFITSVRHLHIVAS